MDLIHNNGNFSLINRFLKRAYKFLSPCWIWIYIALIPLLLTIISPRWFLPNSLIPTVDDWFYTGFFLHYPDFFDVRYFGSRLPWNIFGKVTYDLFGSVLGEFFQALILFYGIMICFFLIIQKIYGKKAAFFSIILLSLTVSFYGLISSNYPTAFSILCILLSYVCIVEYSPEYRITNILLSSFFFLSAIIIQLFAIIFFTGILIFFFYQYGLTRTLLKNITIFFTGSLLTLCGWIIIGYLLTGDIFLLLYQYLFLVSTPLGSSMVFTPWGSMASIIPNPLPLLIGVIAGGVVLNQIRIKWNEKTKFFKKSEILLSNINGDNNILTLITPLIHVLILICYLLIILIQQHTTIIIVPFYYDFLYCTSFIAIPILFYKQILKMGEKFLFLLSIFALFLICIQIMYGPGIISFHYSLLFFVIILIILISLFLIIHKYKRNILFNFRNYGLIFLIFFSVIFLSISFQPHFSTQIFTNNNMDNSVAFNLMLDTDSYIHSFGTNNVSFLYDYNNTFHSNIFHHAHCFFILSNGIDLTQKRFYSNSVNGEINGEYLFNPDFNPILVHLYPIQDSQKKKKIYSIPSEWNITPVASRKFNDPYGGFIIDVYRINQDITQIFPDPYFSIHGVIDYIKRSIVSSGQPVGCVVYGPYALLPPGQYRTSFLFYIPDSINSSDIRISLEISDYDALQQSRTIANKEITYSDLINSKNLITIDFSLAKKGSVQFKVIDFGGSQFVVENITLEKVI